MGGANTKIKKCGQIEDAEQIRIDSAPLHCPICLYVFRKAPEVLPCGHSHCQDCLRNVENYAARDARDNGSRHGDRQISIECPLCRARCSLNRPRVKNYAIEAIIDSLSTINDAEDAINEIIARKSLAIKRFVQNERNLESQVKELEAKVVRMRRAAWTARFVVGVAVAYFGLRLILWLTEANIPI